MARVIINESNLENIADAIRAKNGSSDTYLPSQMASAITALSTGLNIKILTATVSTDQTSTYTMLTDPYLITVLNSPNGFVCMRWLEVASGVSCNMFWITANFTLGYAGTGQAYNSIVLRTVSNGSIQGNFNTKGLAGTNYNGHINITSSGGLYFSNNTTYPLKAGNYEILAGIWADNTNNLIDYFGYTDGKRISTSDGSYRDVSGYTTIEYIDLSEFVNNETVAFHIKGGQFIHKSSPWDDIAYAFYNTSKSWTAGNYTTSGAHGNIAVTVTSTSDTDMVITITGLTTSAINGDYRYLRLCGIGSGANINIQTA